MLSPFLVGGQVMGWAVSLFFACLVGFLAHRVYTLRKGLRALRTAYQSFSEPLLWARWWARNACESPVPGEREGLQRLALTALCSDGPEALRQTLRAGVHLELPERTQHMVDLALGELNAPVKAWEAFSRSNPGKPNHSPEHVARGSVRALAGSLVASGGHPGA
jgi:hypothetical protein